MSCRRAAADRNPFTFDLGTGRSARLLAAGLNYSCAVLDDNSVKCWGANRDGELGVGDTANHGVDLSDRGDALRAVDIVF